MMDRRTLDTLPSCYNCGSRNLNFSCGALFHGWSVFCKQCGCAGKMSKTNPSGYYAAGRLSYARRGEALKNWRQGWIERRAWKEPYLIEQAQHVMPGVVLFQTHTPAGSWK